MRGKRMRGECLKLIKLSTGEELLTIEAIINRGPGSFSDRPQ